MKRRDAAADAVVNLESMTRTEESRVSLSVSRAMIPKLSGLIVTAAVACLAVVVHAGLLDEVHDVLTADAEVQPEGVVSVAFTCDGGFELPQARINDDYCDCEDGTDEMRTSACAHTSVTVSVLTSRVLSSLTVGVMFESGCWTCCRCSFTA